MTILCLTDTITGWLLAATSKNPVKCHISKYVPRNVDLSSRQSGTTRSFCNKMVKLQSELYATAFFFLLARLLFVHQHQSVRAEACKEAKQTRNKQKPKPKPDQKTTSKQNPQKAKHHKAVESFQGLRAEVTPSTKVELESP